MQRRAEAEPSLIVLNRPLLVSHLHMDAKGWVINGDKKVSVFHTVSLGELGYWFHCALLDHESLTNTKIDTLWY